MRSCCVLGPVAGAGAAVANKIDKVGTEEIIQLAVFLHSIPEPTLGGQDW